MPAFAYKNPSRLEIASPPQVVIYFPVLNHLTNEQPSQIAADQQVHTPLVKMLEEARLLSDEIFDFQEVWPFP